MFFEVDLLLFYALNIANKLESVKITLSTYLTIMLKS